LEGGGVARGGIEDLGPGSVLLMSQRAGSGFGIGTCGVEIYSVRIVLGSFLRGRSKDVGLCKQVFWGVGSWG